MSQSPRDFKKPVVVFVEGLDEVNVIGSIAESLGLVVDVWHVGGKEKLATQFPLAVKQATFEVVKAFGIIQDADNNPGGTFASIKNLLEKHALPAPKVPGEMVKDGGRSAGVLVLPGNGRNGYLEDLFLDANEGTGHLLCARAFATCCEGVGSKTFSSKDLAYSLLVALGTPEPRLGRAFQSKAVNADSVAYTELKEFLTRLSEVGAQARVP